MTQELENKIKTATRHNHIGRGWSDNPKIDELQEFASAEIVRIMKEIFTKKVNPVDNLESKS